MTAEERVQFDAAQKFALSARHEIEQLRRALAACEAERDELQEALLSAERNALAESEALVAERDEARADAERWKRTCMDVQVCSSWGHAQQIVGEALATHEEGE